MSLIPPEKRREYASNAAKARYNSMTHEKRVEVAIHASQAFQVSLNDPEKRAAFSKKVSDASTSKHPDHLVRAVVQDYITGLGFLRIAKTYALSSSTVRSILKRAGIKSRQFTPEEHRRQSALRR